MKTSIQVIISALLLFATALFAADVQVNESIPSGKRTIWTSDNTYHLNGRIFVEDKAELHIEAGTVIKGMPGDSTDASVIIVARGGKIFAEGTAEKPIIFTAESDDLNDPLNPAYDTKGLWGGIILLGKATINASGGEANIEGIPTTDPRGLYGGSDDNDNSGVLRYVSIRHGGISIGEGNEINGLTMGGVGRGTTIEYVEVFANLDDGFEWFGGTVNGKHLIAAFCGDDSYDMDQGFRGKLQFIFAIQHPQFGNMCAEHDGAPGSNTAAEPKTYAQVYNATYLGSGKESANAKQQNIFLLREAWGGVYANSIFGDYNGYGVSLKSEDTPDSKDRLDAGELEMKNNIWFNVNGYTLADSIGLEDYTKAHLNAAANTEADPKLMSIDRGQNQKLDPRPAQDSPAWGGDMAAVPQDDFFEHVTYKGAFGATNWTTSWTALAQYGVLALPNAAPTGDVQVTESLAAGRTFWTSDNTYHLNGRIFVEDGAELFIEAGTVIKGFPGDSIDASVLIVARGGKLFAEGTGDRPIVMTAESDDLADPLNPAFDTKGLWGGLILLGHAPINASGGEANIEGIPTTDSRGLYGGSDMYDKSGVIRYVSIRHGGISIGEGNEINGLTMGGVGRGTTVEYVEVFANLDDGFEWFGGTVNGKHLIAAFCGDDCFDHDQGLNSKLQFLFAIQHEQFGNMCAEHDGAPGSNTAAEPKTNVQAYNATYLGSGMTSTNAKQQNMFLLRENWGGNYVNGIFGDYNGYGVSIKSEDTPDSKDRLDAGELNFWGNIFWNVNGYSLADSIGLEEYTATHLQDAANMNVEANPMLMGISRTQDTGLDPRPEWGSPAWWNLVNTPDGDEFFENVSVKGAFGVTNWASGWSALTQYGIMGGNPHTLVDKNVASTPTAFELSANYPNPFNPTTTIEYKLAKDAQVKLSVYNQLGQEVAILVNEVVPAGAYEANWNAADMPSGLYFYRMQAGSEVQSHKMMLIK